MGQHKSNVIRERRRVLLDLLAAGHSLEVIGRKTGYSPKKVETLLRRAGVVAGEERRTKPRDPREMEEKMADKKRAVSREEFEEFKRELREFEERGARDEIETAELAEMAYRIELKEFDSPEGWQRIKRYAERENLPLDEAMIALAEKELPDPPKTSLPDPEESRLDRAAQRIARDRGVTYDVALDAALDAMEGEQA